MNKEILEKLGFGRELKLIAQDKCPICENIICVEDFKDQISKKEYSISGLCQKCQYKMFDN